MLDANKLHDMQNYSSPWPKMSLSSCVACINLGFFCISWQIFTFTKKTLIPHFHLCKFSSIADSSLWFSHYIAFVSVSSFFDTCVYTCFSSVLGLIVLSAPCQKSNHAILTFTFWRHFLVSFFLICPNKALLRYSSHFRMSQGEP